MVLLVSVLVFLERIMLVLLEETGQKHIVLKMEGQRGESVKVVHV